MKVFQILVFGILVSFPIFCDAHPLESQVQISISALIESQVRLVTTYGATSIGTNQATLQGILTTL